MIQTAHFGFFLFFLLIQPLENHIFAQNLPVMETSVTGAVLDSATRQPVELANAFLLNKNKEVVASTFTSATGTFKFSDINPGSYIICVSFIGYKRYYSDTISIETGQTLEIGYISLADESQVMEEVVIRSQQMRIQTKDDKLVYHANADIGNKAGSAIDVLRNTPMVTVDASGGIKLRGNSNIQILLNGVPSNIMAKNLKEALKSIPASTIESIEIITTPSARYEAEGAGGIINIVTKKKTRGTNGMIDLGAGNLEQSLHAEASITKKKFSSNISLGLINEKEILVSERNRTSLTDQAATGTLFQNNRTTQYYRGSNTEFSLEYRADSTQNIRAGISYWNDHMPVKSTLYNLSEIKQNQSEYNQSSKQKNHFNLLDFSLNYQKKFKRKAQEIQLLGQYSNIGEKSAYRTNQVSLKGQPDFTENSSNTGKNNDWSFQADYTHPFNQTGRSILETGIRYAQNRSLSNYSVYNTLIGEDTSRSDEMNYFQTILAAYLSLKFETKNHWIFRPGLRYESTRIGGDFKRNGASFRSLFGNWVPSILISKPIGEKHLFKLNYTERIRRPEIWDLNPYVNASDPKNLTFGNPNLRPELTRTLELGHTFATASGLSLNTGLFFHSNTNGIEYVTGVDSLGISRTTPQNIAAVRRIGFHSNNYFPISENWIIGSAFEVYHVWLDSKALQVKNNATIYSIGINSSYTLPADFSVQLSADYHNGQAFLQGNSSFYYTYRLSINKEFKDKASITVNLNNPFRRNQAQRTTLNAPDFYSNTTERHYDRSFTVTFSWRFGRSPRQTAEDRYAPDTESKEGPKRRSPKI